MSAPERSWAKTLRGWSYCDVQVLPAHALSVIHECADRFDAQADIHEALQEEVKRLRECLAGLVEEIDDCAQPSDWDWYERARAALEESKGD